MGDKKTASKKPPKEKGFGGFKGVWDWMCLGGTFTSSLISQLIAVDLDNYRLSRQRKAIEKLQKVQQAEFEKSMRGE